MCLRPEALHANIPRMLNPDERCSAVLKLAYLVEPLRCLHGEGHDGSHFTFQGALNTISWDEEHTMFTQQSAPDASQVHNDGP